jgi:hypothetical protein
LKECELVMMDGTNRIAQAVDNTGARHAIAFWMFTASVRPKKAALNYTHAFEDDNLNLRGGMLFEAVDVLVLSYVVLTLALRCRVGLYHPLYSYRFLH